MRSPNSSARPGCYRPTATPAWHCSRGCAKRADWVLGRPCGPPRPDGPQKPKDSPVTTATTKAAPTGAPANNLAHPSIRELDRPVKLSAENAPGWGSDVDADTLRALNIP